jgi:uncharacterized protein (TIGR03437 family)
MNSFTGSILRLAAGLTLCAVSAVAGSTPSSISLAATPNPGLYGQIVTLTAAVSSASATGNVTFYDGVTVLGTSRLSGGLASYFTILLPSGKNSLWAYYGGDSTYAASKSATAPENVNSVSGLFQAAVSIAPYGPGFVAVGDFNGDGKADIVFSGEGVGGGFPSVSLVLGNGDGTFNPLKQISGGCGWPQPVAAGDFNGDGKTDLAVGHSCGGTVGIFLGNGDGTFQAEKTYAAGGNPPFIAVGDFNGDGNADLAVSDACTLEQNLNVFAICVGTSTSVLLGNGDGTFRVGTNYNFVGAVAIGDFNGDGKADLVAGGSVLLGNGDGTFRAGTSFGIPGAVVVGDFNGDGRADLAVANSSSSVSVLAGNGDGTFRAAVNYAATPSLIAIASGDFNGDGNADLVSGGSILFGNGDGSFNAAVSYAGGFVANLVAVASFRGDGRAGLAASAGNGLSVILTTTPTADLTIAKSHTGNFTQGQIGATYTLIVSNIGSAATSSLVTVTDSLPTGLTATALSGPGWSCTTATATCTRADALANSNSYPAITVAVNVASNASVSVTNTATVSGGGETNTANDSASDVTSINITATPQTITFASLNNQTLGASPLTLTATASSGLTVSYISTTTGVCTVSGSSVTLVAVGTCSITATQGGNAQYAVATPVTESFLVKNPQTITFGALSNMVFGANLIGLTATASSGLTVTFTSTTQSVCTVSGSTVTIVGTGICSVTAAQAGNTAYSAATNVIQSFTVSQANQTITFGPLSNITLAVPPFSVSATASSGLPVSFVSTTPVICSVSGNIVTSLAAGVCSITAIQAGNANYLGATPVSQSFTIVGPAITQGGITPVYSSSNSIQPGSWISIYGAGLASTTATWSGDFPTSLGGVTVTVDGKPAYLWYVSPTQINLQAPDDAATGVVNVVVTNSSGSSASTVTLAPFVPAMLLLDARHVTGIILRANGSGAYGGGTYDIVGPTGSSLGYATVAARAGDIVELFGVGFGPTTPSVLAGQAFSGAAPTKNTVQLAINGTPVIASFAGLSSAGLYQINVTIPVGLGAGDLSFLATVGGVQTQPGVVISLQ